jgi:MutS domain V
MNGPPPAAGPQTAPSAPEPVATRYRAREARFRRAADREEARSRQLSTVRIALFFIAVAAGSIAVLSPRWREAALGTIAAALVIFIIVAIFHDRVERRRHHYAAFADLNREALYRLAREWQVLPEPPPVALPHDHPYAEDLDLVGHASLLQLIGPPNTPAAHRELAGWLLHVQEVEPHDVAARQASVRELAPRLEERQELQAASLDARRLDAATLEPLLHWAESESWLLRRPWVTIAAIALTITTPTLAAVAYAGGVSGRWWMLTATLGWVLMWSVYDELNRTFQAASGEYSFRSFEHAITLVARMPVQSPLLVAAQNVLNEQPATSGSAAGAGDETRAHGRRAKAEEALSRLRQFVALSDFRLTPIFYVVVQTLVLWDLHAWWLLERWRQHHGRHLRPWLTAVGRVEALAALAALAHDQPQWTFPRVERGLDRLITEDLGHPLLRDDVRVTNDVTVGPPGTFLLVTGSNMSGKSTLLRAIGLNVVLAHAGGPVCARTMALPPVTLHTSMRVSDSLERGLSLFMASLLRLKGVVDAARHADPARRPLLYLLDEVLQGTNSAERQIAVRTIVGHLVRRGALGVVTTHDLELATTPDFTAHADSRHFTEHVSIVNGTMQMTFDYKLRPGPATSGNALLLVRMLGLDAD